MTAQQLEATASDALDDFAGLAFDSIRSLQHEAQELRNEVAGLREALAVKDHALEEAHRELDLMAARVEAAR